ncbi:DNA mismatch repair endonuclease MutL [Spirochaeta cellobiosiphila]|uniref:DNA mismatch repair endonuclease MutL n=1 Tax=Spirochaeta cellobiosiphila TaxID=504483 RepID=UPI0003F65CBC|nr:DNA mismatch repair endonuclease MutL [Spirochaeta cellobiosiphila]
MQTVNERQRVEVLKDNVARKIAAGEVIDRPYSIVRELLDNAIDSGADKITLEIKQGGIDSIRVSDDGCGMTKEDLELCFLPHATSKIRTEDDLLTTKTMGFRGEALSSIATCARTEILSNTSDLGYKLRIEEGKVKSLQPAPCQQGTIIEAKELFFNLPARKKFLKRPASETSLCRTTFHEKAIPFPNIEFRMTIDNKERDLLFKTTQLDRIKDVYNDKIETSMLDELDWQGNGYSIKAILGKPGLNRKDRKYIQVYVNKRKIQEFAFIQAITYGYEQVLPGGVFPVTFLFIDIEPHLIDFNIHPAKKEAKFRNLNEIHHSVVTMIRDYLAGFSIKETQLPLNTYQKELNNMEVKQVYKKPTSYLPQQNTNKYELRQESRSFSQAFEYVKSTKPENKFTYLGQSMNLFLIFEMDSTLYIMDQHAAHERILFEQYKNDPGTIQELLIPERIEVPEESEQKIMAYKESLNKAGFKISQESEGIWNLEALPSRVASLQNTIIQFFISPEGNSDDLMVDLYATMSCRKAIKDGDPISAVTAVDIIDKAISLPVHRCPHGRPIWYEISREELFQLLGRLL